MEEKIEFFQESEESVSSSRQNEEEIDQINKSDRPRYKPKKTKNHVNRSQNSDLIDLTTLSHDDLLIEAERLQKHCFQLKNLLNKATELNSKVSQSSDNGIYVNKKKKNKNRSNRQFDYSKFNRRHVLLKFAYLGWNYQGYILQEGIYNTVENLLFDALIRTKLIESRETSNYHRCGRTDKGVSAFSQVISIDLRSNCASGKGVVVNPNSTVKNENIKNEINYVKLLNGALPPDIRAISWSPVDNEYSSRFDCIERVYRYYFPKGDLDIDLMRDAGKRLCGEKDFRNFCKMDVSNGVVTFFRRIDDIKLKILDKESNEYSTVELIVEGSSFLWHQIRCIVAVLFLVGQKKEEPSIVDELLDIEKCPCKPQYSMSSECPLVLFDCQYDGIDWIYDPIEIEKVIKHLQDQWLTPQIKATVIRRMVDSLHQILEEKNIEELNNDNKSIGTNHRTISQTYSLLQGKSQSHDYIKFADRPKSLSLEHRVDHFVKKRRLDAEVYEKISEANNLAQSLNIYKPNNTKNESQNLDNKYKFKMRKMLKFCFNTTKWNPTKNEWLILLSSLPKEERDRISSYMFKRDSKQTLIGQILIRYCIQLLVNTDWKNICIGRNSKNRPYLKLKETLCLSKIDAVDFTIDFNASHSGDFTIIVAGMFPAKKKTDNLEESPRLGSDVMKIDITRSKIKYPNESDEFLFQHQLSLLERVIDSKFSDPEKNYIYGRLNPVERLTAFYRLWSLKESYVKAQGDGIGFDIKRIECLPRSDLLFDLNGKKGLVVEDTQILVDSKLIKNCKFYEQYFMSNSFPDQHLNQRPNLHVMTHCIIENEKSLKERKDPEIIGEFVEIDMNIILKNTSALDNIDENLNEFEEMWKVFSEKVEKPIEP